MMNFGLRNAAQSFQRFKAKVVQGLDLIVVYVDDTDVASPSPEQHEVHFKQLITRLQDYDLRVHFSKCDF